MNPVIAWILCARRVGWKHSQLDWKALRELYDYTEELVDEKEIRHQPH